MSTTTTPATSSSNYRTDTHNNPTAFTTDIAKEAGLQEGVDYTWGDPFTAGKSILHTARIVGDPVQVTIRVINKLSFLTTIGTHRWLYITIPKLTWDSLSFNQKRDVIGWMYQREGGTAMRSKFPNYGKL